jgi:hypothetical protein
MEIELLTKYFDKPEKVVITKEKYSNNGSLALQANRLDGEPWATLSVNLPESNNLPENQCYIKTWSENEGYLEQLIEKKVVRLHGKAGGFIRAPLVEVLF